MARPVFWEFLTLLLLTGVSNLHDLRADAASNFGDPCQVRYGEVGTDDFRYYENGPGYLKCDNSNGADLVCIPEADTGSFTEDFPGICELGGCFEPRNETQGKVTICHRTCSETNPWVRITIDSSAWTGAQCKHGQHTINTCTGKNLTKWGGQTDDFVLKYHGTRDEVDAQFGGIQADISNYWKHWEPACPAVRNGACCSLDPSSPYGYTCCGRYEIDPVMPEPTERPTEAPTVPPAPTDIPATPAPTVAAPVAEIAKAPTAPFGCRRRLQDLSMEQKWNISDPTFDFSSLKFTLDFEISDFIQSVDQVKSVILLDDCTGSYNGNALNDVVGTAFTSSDGDGKHNIAVDIDIDPSKISSETDVYSEQDVVESVTAGVDFCVRVGLHTPTVAGGDEVNYLETIIRLDVDLSDGFEIASVSVQPLDKCEKQAQDQFLVEGYFCRDGFESDSTLGQERPLNQGDFVKICVRPQQEGLQSFIRMRRIAEFTFTKIGASILNQKAIENGQPSSNGLTELYCTPGYAICYFETLLFASFFTESTTISGSGVADLQFGGEASETSLSPRVPVSTGRALRALSITDTSRLLQQEEAESAAVVEFDLNLDVQEGLVTFGFNSAGTSCKTGGLARILSTAAAGLFAVAFL